jgi:DnaK suppressor protein
VSKTPAQKAPPKKTVAAKAPAVSAPAKPGKPVAKPAPSKHAAVKPASGKPMPAKAAPVKPVAAKTASAKAPTVQLVSLQKPAPAPAKPKSMPPAPNPARAAKPTAKTVAPPAVMKPAPAPVVVQEVPATPPGMAPVVLRKSGRGASKYPAPAVQAPLPPPTSRFADRFAPPRPPTRQMNNLELDTPRHAHKSDPKLANAWKTKTGRELTEPEVLAMPDAEYMNDKQLDFFRIKLQTLKDDLLSNAGETTEHLREDTSIVPDPADRATIEEEHALELRTRDRERKLLKKISQSLQRIDAGDYGFCDETGEPIGLGRLIARPTATLSLEAQQRRELKQKMFGD